uniref:Uncharacterized protein n=1 Tax=Zonotrichia albicollis TaxID=44394 RepID=A0A8D2N6Y2_ZONAL
ICLDKCNHCKHLYDLGFCFYFEAGAFLFTSSLKTKNCFCKEMRFFFNFLRPFVKQKKSYFFLNHFRFSVQFIDLLRRAPRGFLRPPAKGLLNWEHECSCAQHCFIIFNLFKPFLVRSS